MKAERIRQTAMTLEQQFRQEGRQEGERLLLERQLTRQVRATSRMGLPEARRGNPRSTGNVGRGRSRRSLTERRFPGLTGFPKNHFFFPAYRLAFLLKPPPDGSRRPTSD